MNNSYRRTNTEISGCYRGRMYWTEESLRVWLNNGRMIDLGPRPYEKSKLAAEALGLRFIKDGIHVAG